MLAESPIGYWTRLRPTEERRRWCDQSKWRLPGRLANALIDMAVPPSAATVDARSRWNGRNEVGEVVVGLLLGLNRQRSWIEPSPLSAKNRYDGRGALGPSRCSLN